MLETAAFTFLNRPEASPRLRRFVARWLDANHVVDPERSDLLLAVTEAVGNACQHATRQGGCIRVSCHRHKDQVSVEVGDDGPGFVTDRDRIESEPAADEVSGRGLFLMRQLTDELGVRSTDHGTTITLVRSVPGVDGS